MVLSRLKSNFSEQLRAVQARLAARLAPVLARFFKAQASRVVVRYRRGDDLFPPSENAALEGLLRSYYSAMFTEADDLAGALTTKQESVRLQVLLTEAGMRIVAINAETLAAVQEALQEAAAAGYSAYQIVNGVAADGFPGLAAIVEELYKGRAETIARTEMAWASQKAAHDRYEEEGVREVDVLDGPGCGWTRHDDPDIANGSRRSIAEANRYPIAHPNCRRISLPVLRR